MPATAVETPQTAPEIAETGNPIRDALEMIAAVAGPQRALEDAQDRLRAAQDRLASHDRSSPMDPQGFSTVNGWLREASRIVASVLEGHATVAFFEAKQRGEPTKGIEVGPPKPGEVASMVIRMAVGEGAPEPRLLCRALLNLDSRATLTARDLEKCERRLEATASAHRDRWTGSDGEVSQAKAESSFRTILPERAALRARLAETRAAAESIRRTLAKGAKAALGPVDSVADGMHAVRVIAERAVLGGDETLRLLTRERDDVEGQIDALSAVERLKGSLVGSGLAIRREELLASIRDRRAKLIAGLGEDADATAKAAAAGDPVALESVAIAALENPACFPPPLAGRIAELQISALNTAPETSVAALINE